MSKELVISATPHETRVAILEEGQLCEIYVEREKEFALVGSIYKGRVTRVLPGMQSAFVEIGLDSDAFLYVSDFLEHVEEYDQIVTTIEGKVEKMEQEGGRVFAPPTTDATPLTEPPEVLGAAPEPAAAAEGAAATEEEQTSPPPASTIPAQRLDPRERGTRGGYGRDRGRGRRGRWGRRGRGDERRFGRDLPPSKYASNRPYEPRPYEPPADNLEPIILPGESLAKYKDRGIARSPVVAEEPPHTDLPSEPAALRERDERTSAAAEAIEQQESLGVIPSVSIPEAHTEPPATIRSGQAPIESGRTQEPTLPSQLFTPAAHEVAPAPMESGQAPIRSGQAPIESGQAPAEIPAAQLEIKARREHATQEASPAENVPEMTEEEARHLAEHVVEAHREEAEAAAEEAAAAAQEAEEEEAGALEATDTEEADDLAIRQEIFGSVAEGAGAEELPPSREETSLPGGMRNEEPSGVSARVEGDVRPRFQRPMRRGGRRGGRMHGRPQHRPSPGGGQRRPQLISEMLKAGQEIIVQIAKEPLGKKGARITSHVALPGRYLVYMPTVDHIGVSRKIGSAEERSRLRHLLSEMKGSFPGGFIVRTAAGGASDEEIRSDVEFLGKTWADIRARAEQRRAPAILHRDLDLIERILRDHLSPDFTSIWIDNEEEFTKIVEFVNRFQPRLVNRVKLYTKPAPIFEEFGIQQEIDKSLRPKVWLKSGGYIVINHTEAMVAIDVNTGKFVGKGSTRLEDTIVKTNIEAVKEIVRQIRLRDLGGIIVVDFIDMEERKNRARVMQALEEALRDDKAPSKVLAFNEFGLVAITRKRTKQSLERVLCQPCPYCTGSGMVKSVPTICYEIQSEARKMAKDLDAASLTLRVNPEIAKALKTRESALVEELEQWTRKSIIIQSDPTLHWEQYDIF